MYFMYNIQVLMVILMNVKQALHDLHFLSNVTLILQSIVVFFIHIWNLESFLSQQETKIKVCKISVLFPQTFMISSLHKNKSVS